MSTLARLGLQDPTSEEFARNPHHHAISTFFLGCLFAVAVRNLGHTIFLSYHPTPVASDTIPHQHRRDGFALTSPEARRPSYTPGIESGVSSLHIKSEDPKHLVALINAFYGLCALLYFLSLLNFNPTSDATWCSFVAAAGELCADSAQVLALYKIGVDMQHLGVRKPESRTYRLLLLMIFGVCVSRQAFGIGTLRVVPELPSVALCYRRHFSLMFAISTSLAILASVYSSARLYFLVSGTSYSHRRTPFPVDIRVARSLSLLLLNVITLVPGIVVVNISADFVPLAIGGVIVLTAFNHHPRTFAENSDLPLSTTPATATTPSGESGKITIQRISGRRSSVYSDKSGNLLINGTKTPSRPGSTKSSGARASSAHEYDPPLTDLKVSRQPSDSGSFPQHISSHSPPYDSSVRKLGITEPSPMALPSATSTRHIVPRRALISDMDGASNTTSSVPVVPVLTLQSHPQHPSTTLSTQPGLGLRPRPKVPVSQARGGSSRGRHRPPPISTARYPLEVTSPSPSLPYPIVSPSLNPEHGPSNLLQAKSNLGDHSLSRATSFSSAVLGSDIVHHPYASLEETTGAYPLGEVTPLRNVMRDGRVSEDSIPDADFLYLNPDSPGVISRFPGSVRSTAASTIRTVRSKVSIRSSKRMSDALSMASEAPNRTRRRTFGESSLKRVGRWSQAPGTPSSFISKGDHTSYDGSAAGDQSDKDKQRQSGRSSRSVGLAPTEPVPPMPAITYVPPNPHVPYVRPLPRIPTKQPNLRF